MDLPFDWDLPYPSKRQPILGRNVVATSQPLAAQAGLEMLRRGGNAIDAAVATAITLTVVEPTSNGIGSDNFALIWAGGGLHGLNASGRAPKKLDRSHYEGMERIAYYGWDGVTTPGAVSGWLAASEQFGSLPFEQLFEPAIRYARDGFKLGPEVGYYWGRGAKAYPKDMTAWHETFTFDGRVPQIGDTVRLPDHARTLDEIASTNTRSFYHGPLAKKIAGAAREGGSALSTDDLASHQADWVRPISIDYHGWRLNEIPPNGQGIAALIALGILRRFDLESMQVDSVESFHLQIEAMKLAFADAHRYVADPAHMDVDPEALLDESYLAERAGQIDRSRAQDFDHGTPKLGGTVLLTTADAQGNMVSWIQSNYTGFGSGVVIPGTGIAMQNRGCCFSLEHGHPNEIGAGKRPYHTIIPAFVTRENNGREEPVMAFGVMGGFMQPQGHAQVLIRMADYRQNPQAALDAPRWQVHEGLKVTIEPGLDASLYEGLRAMGHELEVAPRRYAAFGRGQAIYRLDDGYVAGSDLRAEGQAVAF